MRPARPAIAALATLAVLALAAPACTGETGTYTVELITAPDSAVLDDVQHVRLTLTSPRTVVEADRGDDGSFDLALDVVADGPSALLRLEGFDANHDLVAYGSSAPLPIAAITADVTIYVAAPLSLARAPVALPSPRSEIAATSLQFGALLAGGRGADGAALADNLIYNAYRHRIDVGLDLPSPRAGMVAGAGTTGFAYLFGGETDPGVPAGTFWRFDTTVAPAGIFLSLDDDPTVARTGAAIAPLGREAFLVTGTPAIVVEGLTGTITPLTTPSSIAGAPASVLVNDAIYTLIIGDGAGATGIVRYASDGITEEDAVPPDALRTGHGAVAVGDQIIVVGGAIAGVPTASAIRAAPAPSTYTAVPDVLATPRTDAAIATVGGVILVAGGRDAANNVVPDAEILDASTLARVATIPMVVPRANAIARALPDGQILIAGGLTADGTPTDVLELFTPAAP